MKGWILKDIIDAESANCDYCGAHLRWHYVIQDGDKVQRVGSECVKSFIDDADPYAAFQMFFAKWRQRRTYYWRKFAGLMWVIGQQKSGAWYLAATTSLHAFPWVFLAPTFESNDAARRYLAAHIMQSGWAGTKLRQVIQEQEAHARIEHDRHYDH